MIAWNKFLSGNQLYKYFELSGFCITFVACMYKKVFSNEKSTFTHHMSLT